jgi:hypothetical protein
MFYRMALKPSLQKLLIWTSISTAAAYQVSLTGQVSAFIPSCALDCFESFIELNYVSTACGDSPSLQCLCSNPTQNGYTVGEEALECIEAAVTLGICQGDEASGKLYWQP